MADFRAAADFLAGVYTAARTAREAWKLLRDFEKAWTTFGLFQEYWNKKHPYSVPQIMPVGNPHDVPGKKVGYGKIRYGSYRWGRSNIARRARVPSRKRRMPFAVAKNIGSLKKKVRKLQQEVESSRGTLTYRNKGYGTSIAQENLCNVFTELTNSCTWIELALAQCRYYNPSIPGTLTVAPGASGDVQREFMVVHSSIRVTLVANYNTRVKYEIWYCEVKHDSNSLPGAFWTAGLADQSTGPLVITQENVYPSDSQILHDNYRVKRVKTGVLEIGSSVSVYSQCKKPFQYDPTLFDTSALDYQRRNHCYGYMVRTCGLVGHDTVEAEFGTTKAGVDCVTDHNFKIEYPAGADIQFTYAITNKTATSTNTFEASYPDVPSFPVFSLHV